MALGDTYTGSQGATQALYDTKAKQYTSMIGNAPVQREKMGEQVLAGATDIPVMGADKDAMIQKLFNADKNMGALNPADTNAYIEDPMAREAALQQREGAISGGVGGLNTIIQTRQRVLGDALDRGMQMYTAGLQAKKAELDILQQALDRLDAKALREEQKASAAAAAAEDQRRWEAQQVLEYTKLDIEKSKKTAMNPKAQEELQSLIAAQAAVDAIDLAYADAAQAKETGPNAIAGMAVIKNPILKATSWYPKLQALEATRQGYALPIASLANINVTGQSSSRLLEQMKQVLPEGTDTVDNAAAKILKLRQKVADKYENLRKTYQVAESDIGLNPYAYRGVSRPTWAMAPETATSTRQSYSDVVNDPNWERLVE